MTKALVCKEPELKAGIEISLKRLRTLEKLFSETMNDYVYAKAAVRNFYLREYLPRLSPLLDEIERLRDALTGGSRPEPVNASVGNMPPLPESLRPEDIGEMKALYRKLAKAYHPDTAREDWKRPFFTERMAEVNEAFRKRDLKALKKLLKRCEAETGLNGRSSLARLAYLRADEAALKEMTAECRFLLAELRIKEEYRTMLEAREKGPSFLEEKEKRLYSLIDIYKRALATRGLRSKERLSVERPYGRRMSFFPEQNGLPPRTASL